MWFSDHFAVHVRLTITSAQPENFDFCIRKASEQLYWFVSRALCADREEQNLRKANTPLTCSLAFQLTLQAKVSTYLPQSECFPSASPFICTPVTNNRQMDPNDNSLDVVRTPQDTSIIEPHWPVSDPTGVPLKLGWKNKFSPAADPHILKL